ncbi:antibiotic biosynthesis monooxygenase [Sphingomonas sp. CGMCC 1.13654]|uniref:Antibiotic biosynthesis monooxygenase n=1 Tax=Sphingomonas chungangi TaxID=2683589 RepID=A0A838LD10_9SPHN|nr:putative quinol monooxygenase [Sphingomonas chungangi]MBA2936016.1 antibiotic biosynthesis monooxygenase [Sphingomonas chungangi]MVW55406.1 antibiotic biosynthesis monooxygenase [Sphingomonas chungangi]
MERRTFLAGSALLGLMNTAANAAPGQPLYGLIGKMKAVPGQRDALIAAILEGSAAMPGCLSYVVAKDADDADAIWITEVWDSEASHDASLQLPAVQASIAKAKDLVASMETGVVTTPVGGIGLKA